MAKHDIKGDKLQIEVIESLEAAKIEIRKILTYNQNHVFDELDLVNRKYVDESVSGLGNFVTTDTDQTNLQGDKTWEGDHQFNKNLLFGNKPAFLTTNGIFFTLDPNENPNITGIQPVIFAYDSQARSIFKYFNGAAGEPRDILAKARGTIQSPANVQINDNIGRRMWQAYFNGDWRRVGYSEMFIQNAANGDYPTGIWSFFMRTNGNIDPLILDEFMRFDPDGKIETYFQLTSNGGFECYGLANFYRVGANDFSAVFEQAVKIGTARLGTYGSENIFIGDLAGNETLDTATAVFNIGVGGGVFRFITTGNRNSAFGHLALTSITEGTYNAAFALQALTFLTTGSFNTAYGAFAGRGVTTGSRNVYLGYSAGYSNNGDGNVFIGYRAGRDEVGVSNKLVIANDNTDAATLIKGDFSTGQLNLPNQPTVSAGNFDLITIADNGNIEKISYADNIQSQFDFLINNLNDRVTFFGTEDIPGTKTFSGGLIVSSASYASMLQADYVTVPTVTSTDNSNNAASTAFVHAYADRFGPTNTVSSASSLALATTTMNMYYTFNGTTTTWTLPPVATNTGVRMFIMNMGSGNITLNSNAGANDIWESGTNKASTIISSSGTTIFYNNGLKWVTL